MKMNSFLVKRMDKMYIYMKVYAAFFLFCIPNILFLTFLSINQSLSIGVIGTILILMPTIPAMFFLYNAITVVRKEGNLKIFYLYKENLKFSLIWGTITLLFVTGVSKYLSIVPDTAKILIVILTTIGILFTIEGILLSTKIIVNIKNMLILSYICVFKFPINSLKILSSLVLTLVIFAYFGVWGGVIMLLIVPTWQLSFSKKMIQEVSELFV